MNLIPKVEVIDIENNYVVFEGGAVAPIDSYLDAEEFYVEDPDDVKEFAFTCWCNHPDLGWLEVEIFQDD